MKLKAFIFMLLISLAGALSARAATDWDDVLYRATRYGDTAERRAGKDAARGVVFSNSVESLRALMDRIHFENVGLQVLAQNLVEQMKKDDAVPVLLDYLKPGPTNTQRIAIYFLGFYSAPESASKLRPVLDNPPLRGITIRTLGKWRSRDDAKAIAGFLSDTNERVRVASANALREIADEQSIPALIQAQGDAVFTVRNTALRALVSFPGAEKQIVEALEKADGIRRRQLIRALSHYPTASARRELARQAKSDDELVRADALRSLLLLEAGAAR